MSLNYGLGENFATLIPILNDMCIFSAPNRTLTAQFPNPSQHANKYIPTFILNSRSVIHFLNHSFRVALPTTDNIIEYHIKIYNKTSGTSTTKKVLDFIPIKSSGTSHSYNIDRKVILGDHFTQHELDNSSCFQFAVMRGSGTGSMGYGGNTMFYAILSPLELFL